MSVSAWREWAVMLVEHEARFGYGITWFSLFCFIVSSFSLKGPAALHRQRHRSRESTGDEPVAPGQP